MWDCHIFYRIGALTMTILEKHEREPLNISNADVHRAFIKAEEFKKLIAKGKTQLEIFEAMVKMIVIDDKE
jgi:hypothetical protein